MAAAYLPPRGAPPISYRCQRPTGQQLHPSWSTLQSPPWPRSLDIADFNCTGVSPITPARAPVPAPAPTSVADAASPQPHNTEAPANGGRELEYLMKSDQLARRIKKCWRAEWGERIKTARRDLMEDKAEWSDLRDAWRARAERCRLGPYVGRIWYRGIRAPCPLLWKHLTTCCTYSCAIYELEGEMLPRYHAKYRPLIDELENEYYPECRKLGPVSAIIRTRERTLRIGIDTE